MEHELRKGNVVESTHSDIDGMEVTDSRKMENGDDSIEMRDMARYSGTSQDLHDMQVLGKTQVLNVCMVLSSREHEADENSETSDLFPHWGLPVH
jgi:hypothetical protein